MFDVDQIEVLKGPQALFYGKASPGGVIALHSNDPSQKFELMAQAVGERLGVKASGGIRTAQDAVAMLDAGASRLGLSGSRAILDGLG